MTASLQITNADLVTEYIGQKAGGAAMQDFDEAGVTALAKVVSEAVENLCHRRFLSTERTEQFNVRRLQKMLALDAFPITIGDPTPVFELREAQDRDFTSSSTILPSTDYYVDTEAGTVLLDNYFRGGAGTVRLQWTGGLAANTTALQTAAPDLVEAASMWVAELWDRRDTQTVRQITGGRAGVGRQFIGLGSPPPLVEALLMQYRASRMTRV